MVSAMDASDAAPPVIQALPNLGPLASITTATTTTVVAAPGSALVRNVKQISFYNNHASTSTTLKIQVNDGTNVVVLANVTLLAGEWLLYTEGGLWLHYDSNGGVYPSTGNKASQAEMEAGTANDKFVTPLSLNWHPGAAKFWVVFTGNSTTITASWNMTSITDGTTTATVTIATDFSGSAWCVQATALGTAATVAAARLAWAYTMAAGSILVACCDGAATTTIQDPTTWCVAGFGDQA
jgi:hypothetical protein